MNILKKIKELNNKKNKEIDKLISPKKKYRINFLKNTDKMGLFEEDKLLLVGDYNFYGIYQPSNKIWVWASSIPGVNKKQIKNLRKIKEMAHLFEEEDEQVMNFYYQLLTQDMLLITDLKMLDYINMLILYLSDDVYYFNPQNSDGNIQFLTFKKITEKYI